MRPLRELDNVLSAGSRVMILGCGLALLAIVAWSDWMTGPHLDFSLFYLVPVCFVAWYAGRRLGFLASAVSVGVWMCVDRLTGAKPSTALVTTWNLVARVAFFAGTALLLEGWKTAGVRLSSMVDQRTAALRRMALQLSAAEEAERRRLAQDMHDALSQSLSLVKINLDAQQRDAAAGIPPDPSRLADCGATLDQVIRQARTVMFDLYPSMLDDLGLVPTLHWYAGEFGRRAGAEVVVSEHGQRASLPTVHYNYLFRAAKELLSNAVRHGHAKEIVVALHWEAERLRLVVDDDGGGFDADAIGEQDHQRQRGLGLPSIEERVTSMGGRVHVESKRGQGSRVIVEIPRQT